jgi:biotin transport system substrate-specific component
MLGTLKTSFAARPAWQLQVLRIVFFVILTAIAAKIRIYLPGNPIPITGQTFAVMLAGMALGSREGALSQLSYMALIAVGLPIDAGGVGALALVTPTGIGPSAGYIVGFVPMAFVAGFGHNRPVAVRFLFGVLSTIVVYIFGTVGLALSRNTTWTLLNLISYTVVPFIVIDFGKALLAASLTKLGSESWLRWS